MQTVAIDNAKYIMYYTTFAEGLNLSNVELSMKYTITLIWRLESFYNYRCENE